MGSFGPTYYKHTTEAQLTQSYQAQHDHSALRKVWIDSRVQRGTEISCAGNKPM